MKPTQFVNRRRVDHHTYLQAMMLIFGIVAIGANSGACERPVARSVIAVATPAAAIVAAKEAWKSIYSKAPQHSAFSPESIAQGEPYVATLENGVWRVVGTLAKGVVGGTPEASRGRVLIKTACR